MAGESAGKKAGRQAGSDYDPTLGPRVVGVGLALAMLVTTLMRGGILAATRASAQPSAQQAHALVHHHSRAQTPARPITKAGAATAALGQLGGAWSALGPAPIVGTEYSGVSPPAKYGNVSGRIQALVTDPTNSSVVFAGTAGGGVWKSTNGGASWTALTDAQASLAIGSLAINSTGTEIYAGTGEEDYGIDSQYGQGILKSSDGGSTWTLLGQATLAGNYVGGIAIDRTTSGATEHLFAATSFGLYQSTDGGSTWVKNANFSSAITAAGTPSGGTFDVFQDPGTASRFWASVGDLCSTEYGQVLVSNDGGSTWGNGDPADLAHPAMRIGLGVGPSNTAYAAFSDCNGNLLKIDKTTTGGSSWSSVMTTVSANHNNYFNVTGSAQGWYDNVVRVDPTNANRAIFGGITVLNTTDGGSTYQDVGQVYMSTAALHPDFHAAAFTGANTLYIGNDGGVSHSTALGGTQASPSWTDVTGNLAVTQFYSGSALSNTTLIGGAQDNGDPGRLGLGIPAAPAWQQYGIGDGIDTAIVPGSNGANFYISVPQNGIFQQTNTISGGFEATPTYAGPCNINTDPACADPVGFVAPFVMDATNGQTLLAGTNRIYKTTTGGLPAGIGGWSAISPDLTTGTTNFLASQDYLASIAVSPAGGINTIFAGSHFGKVEVTTNGAAGSPTWTDATGNLPVPSNANFGFVGGDPWISSLAFNPSNSNEAWAAIGDAFGVGRLWHTSNATSGSPAWTDVTSGGSLPINGMINSVVVDPNTPTTVYVGTGYGAYACTMCSSSPTWSRLGSGLPNVWVQTLTVSSDHQSIVAWTHGRGAFSMPLPLPETHVDCLLVSPGSTGETSCPTGVSLTNSTNLVLSIPSGPSITCSFWVSSLSPTFVTFQGLGPTHIQIPQFNNVGSVGASNNSFGSGGSVTYSSNTVTDTSKSFPASFVGKTIQSKFSTGTVSSVSGNTMTLTANWSSAPVNGDPYQVSPCTDSMGGVDQFVAVNGWSVTFVDAATDEGSTEGSGTTGDGLNLFIPVAGMVIYKAPGSCTFTANPSGPGKYPVNTGYDDNTVLTVNGSGNAGAIPISVSGGACASFGTTASWTGSSVFSQTLRDG